MEAIKVGHRGAMGYEPENTLLSFQKAIDIGADMIELDVRLCKSGELVVMHDSTVDRMTDGHGHIKNLTLIELKGLNEPKNQRIPTLGEVLDLVDKKIKVDIEIKSKNIAWQVCRIIERYIEEKGWSYKNFMVSSFHHAELWKVKLINKDIKIGVLSEVVPPIEFMSFVKTIGAYSVNVPIDRINEKFVSKARKNNLKIFAFATNNTNEIKRAKDLNVDYICSNFPDKI
jgi:glycerophosphoryl diester phosphodiesterase